MRIYGAYHRVPSRADVIPSAAEKQEAKLRRTQELLWPPNPRPQILDVLPYYGWWGELLYIFGQGFSPIYASNVAHFHSNAFTAIETTDKTENEFKVGIPAGVRSGFPNVASSGIGGEYILDYPLSIIAPLSMPGLVSVVEGTNCVYVGYLNNGDPTIAIVYLYVSYPPGPQIAVIDHGVDIDPFLSRVALYGVDKEYCYVKKVADTGGEKKHVYCFTEPLLVPVERAHLHEDKATCGEDCFDPDVANFNIKGIASSDQGNVFFVAYHLGNSNYGRVLRVPRGNNPSNKMINPQFGGAALTFKFPHYRAGIVADTKDGMWGNPGVFAVTNFSDYSGFVHITDSGYTNLGGLDKVVVDLETDRRVSWPYVDTGPIAQVRWYAITNMGVATLSDDTLHDIRGWVDGFDASDDDGNAADTLMLSVNNVSQILMSSDPDNPVNIVNNQLEIVASEVPDLQAQIGFPNPEQIAPRYAKITIKGWNNMEYYLRVLDPRDFAGYAPTVNPAPNPLALDYCRPASSMGPYLNACDNQVWSNNTDFGLCLDYYNCSNPVQDIAVMIQGPPNEVTWTAVLYLKMPAQYSGDNLILQLSEVDFEWSGWPVNPYCSGTQDPKDCKMPVDSYSGVYTSWKREFVEREMMFKWGGLLYHDFDPENCSDPGCDKIFIFSGYWTNFEPLDEIWVFTETTNIPSSGNPSYLSEYKAEKRYIMGYESSCNGHCMILTLDSILTNKYEATNFDDYYEPKFTNGKGAGFGVIHRDSIDCDANPPNPIEDCFYKFKYDKAINDSSSEGQIPYINNAFNDAYTFILDPLDYIGSVPYLYYNFSDNQEANIRWFRFHQLFFKNRDPINPNDPASDDWWKNHDSNFFHVLDCWRDYNNRRGFARPDSHVIFVLYQSHYDLCDSWLGCNSYEWNILFNRVITHELAHEFWVNWYYYCLIDNPAPDCGHCPNSAWCAGLPGCESGDIDEQRCSMHMLGCSNDKTKCTSSSIRFDCNELRGSTVEGIECSSPNYEQPFHIRTKNDPE
ncbi:MAG: hypothetical protein A2Y62_19675 [Candidatus Fischerbacteria bacterium RBG_13_37_8]|uniref:Uncharacterized protein n=1 Tax=Candidatus Fischerbacteria bacterium RBG_13_37_8 TaxID=1817863 RepID=A0A1F5VXS4_9BACT|nr:MAG: hypothetical protein A2Y62_19675 [Candidatus Fischerbacteria bacterium RBG_13_37_8]